MNDERFWEWLKLRAELLWVDTTLIFIRATDWAWRVPLALRLRWVKLKIQLAVLKAIRAVFGNIWIPL